MIDAKEYAALRRYFDAHQNLKSCISYECAARALADANVAEQELIAINILDKKEAEEC